MVNATNSDGNSSDTADQGGEMVRNYKMKALQKDEQTRDQKEVDYMGFKITQSRSSSNNEYKYPQVGKTGVDAEHGSCPQMVYIMKKL